MIFATKNGKLDSGQEAALARLRADLAKPGAKLLLHLHGGLVDDASGRRIADRLSGPRPDGFGLGAEWTQIYVVWRTGALETIRTNWTDLAHNDRLYRVLLQKLVKFAADKLGSPKLEGRSAAAATGLSEAEIRRKLDGKADKRAPFDDIDVEIETTPAGGRGPNLGPLDDGALAREFEDVLTQDDGFNAAVADIDGYVNEEADGRTALAPADRSRGEASYGRLSGGVRQPIDAIRPSQAAGRRGAIGVGAFLLKHAARIAYRSFKRFRTHRDHGFHATLVEELGRELYGDLIGASIWGMMVQDAADHFAEGGFGRQLLEAIPANNPVRIIVTAHSAGSIWATQLMKAIAASGRPIDLDLVLLAPAVRTDLFAQAIDAAGDRVQQCRMFTMNDALERADAVLGHDKGYIYPSSLLYLVSGLFEEISDKAFADAPLLGMQRFVGADWLKDEQQEVARKIEAFFLKSGRGIDYAPSPGVTMSDSHGGFDTEHMTLRSVARLFEQP